jgi:MFS family permease
MSETAPSVPWYRELTRYHWFVLAVCTLGWMFDCLDQQLFIIVRKDAVEALVDKPEAIETFTTLATSVLLVGWATGGILFGIMGDRLGRARTMIFTILSYSVFTGLSGLAYGVWDFMLYRFMTGMGVGGQFAVGVSLVAETMPDRARPHALGLLQALSAVGNISAALIGLSFNHLQRAEALPFPSWRGVFAVGILPALLAVLVMTRLKEPERWRKAVAEGVGKKKAGSLKEMFGVARWRHRAIVGMLLASSGVIGLWAIGFFSPDLNQSVFRKVYEQQARDEGSAENDRQLLRLALQSPGQLDEVAKTLRPQFLLSPDASNKDPQEIYTAALVLQAAGKPVSGEAVLAALTDPRQLEAASQVVREAAGQDLPGALNDAIKTMSAGVRPQSDEDQRRRVDYLAGGSGSTGSVAQYADAVIARHKQISADASWWSPITSMLFNIGAFFGIYTFSRVTARIGRRRAFAGALVAAAISTAVAFLYMDSPGDVYWMVPLMGFCQLSLFGGYAIYFPELFPTRLRSTGTSLCYNIARFVAATGPIGLGLLTRYVFVGSEEPMRYAGVTMCVVFLLGLLVLPFAPETKDQPLPE